MLKTQTASSVLNVLRYYAGICVKKPSMHTPGRLQRVKIQSQSVFNCAVDGCAWSDSHPCHLTPREKSPMPIEQEAAWAYSWHRHCQRERNILSLPRIEPRFLGGLFRGLLITKVLQQTAECDKAYSDLFLNRPFKCISKRISVQKNLSY